MAFLWTGPTYKTKRNIFVFYQSEPASSLSLVEQGGLFTNKQSEVQIILVCPVSEAVASCKEKLEMKNIAAKWDLT